MTVSTPEQRYWEKVNKDGPVSTILGTRCWTWTAYCDDKGYGRFNALSFGTTMAHRIALILAGDDPVDLQADHRCHNPSCVNPDHLRAVTAKQNGENRIGACARSRTGVRGVAFDDAPGLKKRWHVTVGHNQQLFDCGRFATLAEADAVAKAKRLELFTHNDMDRMAAA